MKNFGKIFLIVFLLLLSGFLGFLFSWYMHKDKQEVTEQSDVQTVQTFHFPALFVQQLKNDPEAGKKIYKEFCVACHAKNPVIDVNAPAVGDLKAWKQRRKMGEKQLLEFTIHGTGAMPARGGCFECSDEQLRETIKYMLQ